MASRSRSRFKKWIPPREHKMPHKVEIDKVYVLVNGERENLYVVEGDIALAFTNLQEAGNYIKNEKKENKYLPELFIVSLWITDIGKSRVSVKSLAVYVVLGQQTNRIYGDCYYSKQNADYASMEINLTRMEGQEETYVRGLVVV